MLQPWGPFAHLVAETTSLVGARRTGSTVADVELPVLPAADAEKETQDVRLLALVQLGNVPARRRVSNEVGREASLLVLLTCRLPFLLPGRKREAGTVSVVDSSQKKNQLFAESGNGGRADAKE